MLQCVFPYFLQLRVFNTVCHGERIYRCRAPAFVRSHFFFVKLIFDITSICWLILSSYTYMHICIYNIHICIIYIDARVLFCSLSCNIYDYIHILLYIICSVSTLTAPTFVFFHCVLFLLNILALTLSCFHGALHR